MKETGVTISTIDAGYLIQVQGRANFDYAVPVRDLAKNLSGDEKLCFDLSECSAMDSTFMGVLSMIGLKARRGSGAVDIFGASDNLKNLLKGLGVAKLFNYTSDAVTADPNAVRQQSGDMRTTAETVLEAHQKLVEADEHNAEKFKQVIKFAQEDVDRLKP